MQAIRRKDEQMDILQRKWLKWAYRSLQEPRFTLSERGSLLCYISPSFNQGKDHLPST